MDNALTEERAEMDFFDIIMTNKRCSTGGFFAWKSERYATAGTSCEVVLKLFMKQTGR